MNRQLGKSIGIYGIVTSGESWKFYRLTVDGEVSESLRHRTGEMMILLGLLRAFLELWKQDLD